jgi:hypothetical protein
MDAETKAILLELVGDLQDLRANQVVLAARVGSGVDSEVARNAKNKASEQVAEDYADLRARIEKA